MKTKISQVSYKSKPICSLSALCKALDVTAEDLHQLASSAAQLYRKAKPITKADGKTRQPYDAFPPLKRLHNKIKTEIFNKVSYPKYLTGSLKGTDYRVNASLHAGAKIVICEDIESFFPSTSADRVYKIWRNFFRFSNDVAKILTSLTTKDDELPQGAITSSYLANLAFYSEEDQLQKAFSENGIMYSRYVDDITISSKEFLDVEQQSKAIAKIYGMLRKCGYKAKRRKHEVYTDKRRMLTTKLLVNKRPALPRNERANIRAAVFQLERKANCGNIRPLDIKNELNTISGRVGTLCRFHPREGALLRAKLSKIRKSLEK